MSKVLAARPRVVPHFTPAERAARGKAARAEVPRTLQAEITIPGDRDPVALLEEQAVKRAPELVPIRRSGEPNVPKFERCASPHSWVRMPEFGVRPRR